MLEMYLKIFENDVIMLQLCVDSDERFGNVYHQFAQAYFYPFFNNVYLNY